MYGNTPEAAEARQMTTLDAMRGEVGPCREWVGDDRCNEPSEYILWGKLISPDALGPRCHDHAALHIGERALGDPTWAIVDLWKLAQKIDEAHREARR